MLCVESFQTYPYQSCAFRQPTVSHHSLSSSLPSLSYRSLAFFHPVESYGSVPKSGQWENTENVTLRKRLIPISISPF